MPKGSFVIALLFAISMPIKAQPITGLCVGDKKMYYLTGRKIHCQEIKSNILVAKKDLAKDTLIPYKLFKKALYLYGINGDSAVKDCRKTIKNFQLINVSYNNYFVYVSVMFQTNTAKLSKYRYAVLQYDTALIFRNYYVVKDVFFNGYTIYPPFHSNEFSIERNLLLMLYHPGDSSFLSYAGYEFRKDKNELMMGYHTTKEFKLVKNTLLEAHHRTVLSPVVYPVINSNSKYFYHFPNPILYNIKNNSVIDPYQLKHRIDSFNINNINRLSSNLSLNFEGAHAIYKNIILAASLIGEHIFMVVSNKNSLKTDIVRYNLATHLEEIITMDIPLENNYFVFDQSKLYSLNNKDVRLIAEIDLRNLKF